MSAATSTLIALLGWAVPIVIALGFMMKLYRSPSAEELAEADSIQPDDHASHAEPR